MNKSGLKLGNIIANIGELENHFSLQENPLDVLITLQERLETIISYYLKDRENTANIDTNAIVTNSWIAPDSVIYDFANIRNSWIGNGCVIGHCCEVVNSILIGNCKLSRFTYVGRSILGRKVWVGACVGLSTHILETLETDYSQKKSINPRDKKIGSIVGDYTQICFGTHIYPASIIGQNCEILSHSLIRGFVPNNSLILQKRSQKIVESRNWLKIRGFLEI